MKNSNFAVLLVGIAIIIQMIVIWSQNATAASEPRYDWSHVPMAVRESLDPVLGDPEAVLHGWDQGLIDIQDYINTLEPNGPWGGDAIREWAYASAVDSVREGAFQYIDNYVEAHPEESGLASAWNRVKYWAQVEP